MAGASQAALLGALAILAAGCVTSPAGLGPASLRLPVELPAVPGAPIVQDHDHGDASLHTASFAVELVARATGPESPIPAGTSFGEVDVKDGWAYVCRGGVDEGVGPIRGTRGGFIVVDVSDPRAPRDAGSFEGVGCADIKVNDANDLVLYATQRNPPHELLISAAPLPQKLPRGLYLVNVADKAAPTVERFVPLPVNGVHTVHYAHLEGRELVFLQAYDWFPDGGLGTGVSTGMNTPGTQRLHIYEVARAPDGLRDLRLLSVFALPEPAPPGTNYYPHDTTVQKHPLTGEWLAYVAYWDHGLVILNIDDPSRPRLVSVFDDTSPSRHVKIHQARPFPHLIAGKHVTVLEPELPSADESGQFTLVDTSDPAQPKRLGYWELPGDIVIPGGLLFSPHNFNLAHGRIYLAHNHAGVWVVDVGSAERLLQPASVGFFQPHQREREEPSCESRVWSAFHVQGYIYATDNCSGLNVLRFEGDRGLEGQGPARVMPAEGSSEDVARLRAP